MNQVVIVTGSAQGMGLGIAKNFLTKGYKVALGDRKIDILRKEYENLLKNHSEDSILCHELDVTNTKVCESISQTTFKKWNRIDILVNCAGIASGTDFVENMSDEVWEKAIDVNLNGTFKMCRSVIQYMKKNNFGRIINLASMAGKEGNPRASHYSSSKAGVIGFTKSLGKELAEDNITVNCIAPAVIDTPMIKDVGQEQLKYMIDKIPMKRMGTVEDIVHLINYIADKNTTFSTAAVFDLSGGRATY